MNVNIVDDRITPEMCRPANGDAGIDLYSAMSKEIGIVSGGTASIGSGLKVAIPKGHVGLLVPRSSTGVKWLTIANTVGIIDSGYRGEVIMKCTNKSDHYISVKPLEKIAQLVVLSHLDYQKLDFVESLDDTERGEGGFGSTGK